MAPQTFGLWFWNERFWLPKNTTWADLRNTDDTTFAQASDLWVVFPYSVMLYILRFIIERFIARPIGVALHISNAPNKPPSHNPVLDRVYETITTNPQGERLEGLCKQLDWNERQVHRWFRRKRDMNRPSKLAKFTETVWRFLLYAFLFVFGNITMYHAAPDCPWITRTCWQGYPDKQQLIQFSYWYYQLELSFYASCAVSQFFDVKRKDFWPMCIHHIATILLISFSYSINMLNIGTLIMLLHDFSDIFLESSKLAKYSGHETAATIGLVTFSLTFGLARLVYFPFWVLHSVWFECWNLVGPFPSWYIFLIWLAVLQILHIYWFTFIISGFFKVFRKGEAVNDARSDSEMSDTDDETTTTKPTAAVTTEHNHTDGLNSRSEKNGVTKRKSPGKS